MGASAIRAAKRRYPEKHITLALVLPALSNQLNTDKYKAAIQIRNRWLVDRADAVIAYICRDFGGALATADTPKGKARRSSI